MGKVDSVRLTRRFSASPDQVFDAWVNLDLLTALASANSCGRCQGGRALPPRSIAAGGRALGYRGRSRVGTRSTHGDDLDVRRPDGFDRPHGSVANHRFPYAWFDYRNRTAA